MVKKRTLRPDEKALWRKVAKSVTPLDPDRVKRLDSGVEPDVEKGSKQGTVRRKKHLPPHPHVGDPVKRPPVPVDRSAEKRLRRGDVQIDARIDLHGMTQQQARLSLNRFLSAAQARGDRVVLVITGKGIMRTQRPAEPWDFPEQPGVLRRKLPEWLGDPLVSPIVSGYSPAHIRHGGSGAFYVTLRRR